MNPSQQIEHLTTGAPLVATDPSVAPDSGILTNTEVPSIGRILNPTAIAFNNPAGTGAAFDKRDAVYGIYCRWPEKNTTVNGSLQQGSELMRISLNPNQYPLRLRDWVNFHRSCIPALDISIVIGGAAGTISWLALGWIPDDTVTNVTLDDLQQVACEHMNMNNTTTLSFILNDNRYSGMYRKLPNDNEPYPAMVLMVNHPALNVQRNDDVNYPIDVYVRLAPHAIFMEPFNFIGTPDSTPNSLDLFPYLKIPTVDFLIGTTTAPNRIEATTYFPDCGYITGAFVPQFNYQNLCGIAFTGTERFVVFGKPTRISSSQWDEQYAIFGPNGRNTLFPRRVLTRILFGYGNIPTDYTNFNEINQFPQIRSTVYAIPKLTIRGNGITYSASSVHVFESGLLIDFEHDMTLNATYTPQMYYFKTEDSFNSFDNDFTYGTGPKVTTLQWLGITAGELFNGINVWAPTSGQNKLDDYIQVNPFRMVDRFYTFTFIQTGNTTGSSRLPSSLSTFNVVRPGTTSQDLGDSSFNPIFAPDISGARTIMEDIANKLKTQWLAFELMVNGVNMGTIAYADGVLAVRTPSIRMIQPSNSTHIVFQDIRATANPVGIPPFSLRGYSSWVNTAQTMEKPRFTLPLLQKQSLLGASMVASGLGGLFGGIGGALEKQMDRRYMLKYLDRQLEGNLRLQDTRNQGLIELENQRLQNHMKILGITSVSALQGDYLDHTIGTQTSPSDTMPQKIFNSTMSQTVPQNRNIPISYFSIQPPTYSSLSTTIPNKSFLYSPSQIEARKPPSNTSFLHTIGKQYKSETSPNSNNYSAKTSLAPNTDKNSVLGTQVKNTSFLHNRSNNIRQYANPSTLHGPPSTSQDRINMELINEEMDTVLPPSNPIIPKPNYSDPNETSMMLG